MLLEMNLKCKERCASLEIITNEWKSLEFHFEKSCANPVSVDRSSLCAGVSVGARKRE